MMIALNDVKGNKSTILIQPKETHLTGIDTTYGSILDPPKEAAKPSVQRPNDTGKPIAPASLGSEDEDGAMGDDGVTYLELLQRNKPFRFFLGSYIANHMGEWLTYLASISAIEKIQRDSGMETTSRAAISTLIVARLTPIILMSPFGGVLADGRDRRKSMIVLDVAGAGVALLFIAATRRKSIMMIYMATFLQECITGMYEPSRSAIIPLLVPDGQGLKQATTLSVLAWSLCAAFGSASGGFLVSLFGIRTCYFIDSMTYLLSALLMIRVGGTYNVSTNESKESPWSIIRGMIFGGVHYLRTSLFGGLVFLKLSGGLMYGGIDVLNVSFAERGGEEGKSARLGILFATMGIGNLIGPLVADRFTDMTQPRSIQLACLYGFAVSVFGLFMMSLFRPFWVICVLSGVRAMGSTIVWINSSLLMQKFSTPNMLGRVTAMDYALALTGEGASAVVAGVLQDRGLDAEGVTLRLAIFGTLLTLLWTFYHFSGKGAGFKEGPKRARSNDYLETLSLAHSHSDS